MSFPGASVGLNLFQVVALISQSSLQLCFSESDSQQSLLFTLGREGPSESGQFQGLPEAILSHLLSYGAFLLGGIFQSQKKLL